MKRCLAFVIVATLLFSSTTVSAATKTTTAKQNADYMMSTNADGVPNWFNGAYYSDNYADLKEIFNTNEKLLYKHSLNFGFDEARLVLPVLDVVKYREYYPDLDKAFGDNWKLYIRHYFEFGIAEGRENFTDFDAETYLSLNEDLQNKFGDDLGAATRHYIEFGYAEGREYHLPESEESSLIYYLINLDNTTPGDDSTDDGDTGNEDVNPTPGDGSTDDGNTGNEDVNPTPGDDTTDDGNTGNEDVNPTPDDDSNDDGIPDNGDITVDNGDGSYSIATYVDGKLTKSKNYDANGTLINEALFYETGEPKAETGYHPDGKKSYYIEYDAQGHTLLYIVYASDGITESTREEYTYDSDGNLISSEKGTLLDDGTYMIRTSANNVETGYKLYDSNKILREEITFYADGATKTSAAYREDGTKIEYSERNERGNDVLYIEYGEDGITEDYKLEVEYYSDGQTPKVETQYYSTGSKHVTEYYEYGEVKSMTKYDENGNITFQHIT